MWLGVPILGLVKPQSFKLMLKLASKINEVLYGFRLVPVSEEVFIQRVRLWCSVFLLIGLSFLWAMLTGRLQ